MEPPASPGAARARLVDGLRQHGHALSRPLQRAFAQVPRHVFVPEVEPSAAYQDEAIVIKLGPDGLPVSSSSQPAMMAIMLDQLGLEPGHRVLEIGTGSGYNAAVMQAVVGSRGQVVTVDIDPDLAVRAERALRAAGCDAVVVRCADGGYGDPAGAPFDRIIVTAGAWDIAPAWLDQVAPGGRLVLPLSVRGIQLSVALQRAGVAAAWRSMSAWRCGFVRMLGAFAGPEQARWLGGPRALVVQISDGHPLDAAGLEAALDDVPADEPVAATAADAADLDVWLTMAEDLIDAGPLDRLTVLAAEALPAGAPRPPFSGLISHANAAQRLGFAVLVPSEPAVIRGFGPGGPALATRLAQLSAGWVAHGRPGTRAIEFSVHPAGRAPRRQGAAGLLVLPRPSVTIEVGWQEVGWPA